MEILEGLTAPGSGGNSGLSVEQILLSLLLAFVLSQLTAWAYVYTHTGISYSRTFVHAIILLAIIIALGMMVIGNNLVIAFGMIGALAVIRFRNILKDTRDTAFVFFSLVLGMATGTGSYTLAVVGTLVFCFLLLYLHWSRFGSRTTGDSFVRFHLAGGGVFAPAFQEVFSRHCQAVHLVSQRFRESGAGEMAYRLTMRDPLQAELLVAELNALEGISNVTFVLQEEQAEI